MENECFKNPNCPICDGSVSLPVAPAGQWDMRRIVQSFEFGPTLSAHWDLELYCHGRREMTEVVKLDVRLDGRGHNPGFSKRPLSTYHVQCSVTGCEALTDQMRYLLGVTEAPPTIEPLDPSLIKPIVLPGHFLVFGDNEGRPIAHVMVPLVHLVASFTRSD